jgi:hypothetical protein
MMGILSRWSPSERKILQRKLALLSEQTLPCPPEIQRWARWLV